MQHAINRYHRMLLLVALSFTLLACGGGDPPVPVWVLAGRTGIHSRRRLDALEHHDPHVLRTAPSPRR